MEQKESESIRRDVQTAIELQERIGCLSEDGLAYVLTKNRDWNSNHAREIAELAWVEMYAEK